MEDKPLAHGELLKRIRRLNEIGVTLSAEKDRDKLLEGILLGAKELTHADGGTIYIVGDDHCLHFEIVRTTSLQLAWGGTTGNAVKLPAIPLYDEEGCPDKRTVAAYAALTGETVNISDAYTAEGFDFTGTRRFDTQMGYRSRSFLTVPLKNHEGEVIGVLQLINAQDPTTARIKAFSDDDQHLVESLASQAAIAMTNHHLIDSLNAMLESFIRAIADAIDAKSPYTGNHCRRVPVLTDLLVDAINTTDEGPLKDVTFSQSDRYELQMAAWLHDCGKVTTPIHVVDKSTRLETVFDKIHLIDTRFEVLRRDAEIKCLRKKLQLLQEGTVDRLTTCDDELQETLRVLADEQQFLRRCNQCTDIVDHEKEERIKNISWRCFETNEGVREQLLSDNDVRDVSVGQGTLTTGEREVVNSHVGATINILKNLTYPAHLKNIPEIAGKHHERVDGRGYPQGLTKEQMSVQARMLAIADIFEALTSGERPYKKAIPLSKALKILNDIKDDGHIDPDIFDVFVKKKVYEKYAEKYL